jgi:dihydropyrimidinase
MFGTVSSDDHYTGHKAAAFGGTTTVMDFVPQDFSSLVESVRAWRAKADGKAAVDFGFHMNITRFDETVAGEIPKLLEEGITTLKVFTAYNGRLRLQDGDIFQVMRIANQYGLLTMLHAENGDVIEVLVSEALTAGHRSPVWHALTRPAWGAAESVLRGCALAAQVNAPLYIVHMNTAKGVAQAKYARRHGVKVMLETCPQYLFFTIEDLKREDGSKWICSPPMRTDSDNAELWNALSDGTLHTVATDHCPFFFDGRKPIVYEGNRIAISGKELGRDDFTKIPNGLPGVQDRLPILWTSGVVSGRLSENQFVALTSTNASKIFGLYPRKGTIIPGADADLVVWDPNRKVTYGLELAHHRTDYNLYEGWELTGYPEKVFLRGHLIVDGDKWMGSPGMGKFLYRNPSGEIL